METTVVMTSAVDLLWILRRCRGGGAVNLQTEDERMQSSRDGRLSYRRRPRPAGGGTGPAGLWIIPGYWRCLLELKLISFSLCRSHTVGSYFKVFLSVSEYLIKDIKHKAKETKVRTLSVQKLNCKQKGNMPSHALWLADQGSCPCWTIDFHEQTCLWYLCIHEYLP